MTIKIKKLHPNAVLPKYAHGSDEDAGMDLYAVEAVSLEPGVPTLVNTGIAIELPPGYEAQVRPRGGMALKYGITVLNSPGTVDPGYRGEIGVIMIKHVQPHVVCTTERQYKYPIAVGDRIAQLVIARYETVVWYEGELGESERGVGAYGSSGSGVKHLAGPSDVCVCGHKKTWHAHIRTEEADPGAMVLFGSCQPNCGCATYREADVKVDSTKGRHG